MTFAWKLAYIKLNTAQCHDAMQSKTLRAGNLRGAPPPRRQSHWCTSVSRSRVSVLFFIHTLITFPSSNKKNRTLIQLNGLNQGKVWNGTGTQPQDSHWWSSIIFLQHTVKLFVRALNESCDEKQTSIRPGKHNRERRKRPSFRFVTNSWKLASVSTC